MSEQTTKQKMSFQIMKEDFYEILRLAKVTSPEIPISKNYAQRLWVYSLEPSWGSLMTIDVHLVGITHYSVSGKNNFFLDINDTLRIVRSFPKKSILEVTLEEGKATIKNGNQVVEINCVVNENEELKLDFSITHAEIKTSPDIFKAILRGVYKKADTIVFENDGKDKIKEMAKDGWNNFCFTTIINDTVVRKGNGTIEPKVKVVNDFRAGYDEKKLFRLFTSMKFKEVSITFANSKASRSDYEPAMIVKGSKLAYDMAYYLAPAYIG